MKPSSNKEKSSQIVQNNFPATDFIFNSNQKRYNTLLQDLKNNNLKGLDAYPDTVNEGIDTMSNYCDAPTAGMSGFHTTWTSSGGQFEQGQGPSAAELQAMPPVAVSNGWNI